MSYDLTIARECLRLAGRVYDSHSFECANTSTQVLFGEIPARPGLLLISFAGTRVLRDMLTDARFLFKERWALGLKERSARVHRGFGSCYRAVREKVRAQARTAQQIIVGGHSLGGAEGLLCAQDLDQLGMPVAAVHTFGCPRVGNGHWRDLYNSRLHDITFRWEAQGDPVPWSPPWLLNGYRHVGRAAYLKNDGRIIVDTALWEHVPAFFEQFHKLDSERCELFGLFDPHALANYEKLFSKLA